MWLTCRYGPATAPRCPGLGHRLLRSGVLAWVGDAQARGVVRYRPGGVIGVADVHRLSHRLRDGHKRDGVPVLHRYHVRRRLPDNQERANPLWPVFQPMGQLVTLIEDRLTLPFLATVGFGEELIVMVVAYFSGRYQRKRGTPCRVV